MRLVVAESAVGVYAAPPLDVLVFLALPLTVPAGSAPGAAPAGLDVQISGRRLRDIIGDLSSRSGAPREPKAIRLPDELASVPALSQLPPAVGWVGTGSGTAAELRTQVAEAVSDFRAQAPEGASDAELLPLAEQLWDAPAWGGLPLRALHAARLFNFLSHPQQPVHAGEHGQWRRLATPRGQVFVNSSPGVMTGLSLTVLR